MVLSRVKDERMIRALLILWNIAVFLLYGVDKWKARHKKRRISEKSMLSAAFFFGSGGALLGMLLFWHKTKKPAFLFMVPFFLILNVVGIYFLMRFAL